MELDCLQRLGAYDLTGHICLAQADGHRFPSVTRLCTISKPLLSGGHCPQCFLCINLFIPCCYCPYLDRMGWNTPPAQKEVFQPISDVDPTLRAPLLYLASSIPNLLPQGETALVHQPSTSSTYPTPGLSGRWSLARSGLPLGTFTPSLPAPPHADPEGIFLESKLRFKPSGQERLQTPPV